MQPVTSGAWPGRRVPLTVYLVGFKDRVQSACRVAWSFGCERVVLVDSVLTGRQHLHSARALLIETAPVLPTSPAGILVLEINGVTPIADVDWRGFHSIVVGGSGVQLDVTRYPSARIPERPPCLIGDQALAIALYERQQAPCL